jgi:transposase-like protein
MIRRVLETKVALTEAAETAGMSATTAGKWVRRYRTVTVRRSAGERPLRPWACART